MFPELAPRWAANEPGTVFAVPVNPESKRADERNVGHRSRASAAMAYDEASSATRGAPSIAQMFGSEFAPHLSKIGTGPR